VGAPLTGNARAGLHPENPAKNPIEVAERAAVTVARAMSLGIEFSTKSGLVRRMPLNDQMATALDRLSRREHFTSPN
jgi:hypothetical protein